MNYSTKVLFFKGPEEDLYRQEKCQKLLVGSTKKLKHTHEIYNGCVNGTSLMELSQFSKSDSNLNLYPIIYLFSHGNIDFYSHSIALAKNFTISTTFLFMHLGSAPMHVELFSCHSGAAHAHTLPYGASLVTHSSKDQPSLLAKDWEELYLSFEEFRDNPFINYALTISFALEQHTSLSINTRTGVQTFEVKWQYDVCTVRAIRTWQNSKIADLTYFYEQALDKGLPEHVSIYVEDAIKFISQERHEIDRVQSQYFEQMLAFTFFSALNQNNAAKIKCLIKLGVSTNTTLTTVTGDLDAPLEFCLQKGNLLSLKALIQAGADVNALYDGVPPLLSATRKGDVGAVKIFIEESNADINLPDANGVTPTYEAAVDGYAEIVDILITAGANANKTRGDGVSPLYAATRKGHVGVVKILIEKWKADVNQPGPYGVTPIYEAALNGHLEILEILLNAGGNANQARDNGVSPLYAAIYKDHDEIAMYLINRSANANQACKDGTTPFHIAAYKGKWKIIEKMLEVSGYNNSPSEDGTPLEIACKYGHPDIVYRFIPFSHLENEQKAMKCIESNTSYILSSAYSEPYLCMSGKCPIDEGL